MCPRQHFTCIASYCHESRLFSRPLAKANHGSAILPKDEVKLKEEAKPASQKEIENSELESLSATLVKAARERDKAQRELAATKQALFKAEAENRQCYEKIASLEKQVETMNDDDDEGARGSARQNQSKLTLAWFGTLALLLESESARLTKSQPEWEGSVLQSIARVLQTFSMRFFSKGIVTTAGDGGAPRTSLYNVVVDSPEEGHHGKVPGRRLAL